MSKAVNPAEQPPQRIAESIEGLVGQKAEPAFKRIQVIVNPVSGPDRPILKTLNSVFKELGLDWDIFITKRGGDAKRLARKAVSAKVDAVVVYGGDGTVLEVACGMLGSTVPLVILPGGTANVLSMELGIPRELAQAAMLLDGQRSTIRTLDMGMVGRQPFFHMGIGIEGKMVAGADRQAKDNSGTLAYIFAALKQLAAPKPVHFRLTLDGEKVEVDGLNCMVTTFGSIGIAGLKLSHTIDMSDGLLDVIVIRDVNLQTLIAAAGRAITSGDVAEPLLQWQAKKITIKVEPPQSVVYDGELMEMEGIRAKVLPQALRVVVPALVGGQ